MILYTALDVAAKGSFILVYVLRVPARHHLRSAKNSGPAPPPAPPAEAAAEDVPAACRGCYARGGGGGGEG